MADGYKLGQKNAIKTNAERRIEAAWDGAVATAKFIYNTGMQIAERLIPQGASELASALYPGNALVQNLDAPQVDAPTVEASTQASGDAKAETRTQAITPAARVESLSQAVTSPSAPSQGLEAYMSGNYSKDVYTPSTQPEIVSSYMSGNYTPRVDSPSQSLNAEMAEDYAQRAIFDRSVDFSDMQMGLMASPGVVDAPRIEPIEPPQQDGMSM